MAVFLLLGGIHGYLCPLDQGVHIPAMLREEGHSHAGLDVQGHAIQVEGENQGLGDPFEKVLQALLAVDPGQEDGELVPSHSGQGIIVVDDPAQTEGNLF